LERYAKNKGCAVCREPTGGIYKTAHKLIKKLKKRDEGQEEEEEEDVAKGIQGEATTGWTIPGGEGRFKPHKVV